MQPYQNYYYGNPGGDSGTIQGDSNDHEPHGTGSWYSGYTPPDGPTPEPQAQSQTQGMAETGTLSPTRFEYGLSSEAQRMVAEEHFNNAILITLLVIGVMFFVYLWFYLSPLFRNRNPLSSKRSNSYKAGFITPFMSRNRCLGRARGAALSHREGGGTTGVAGPGEASASSWKTFQPWSDEWSDDTSMKQAPFPHGKPPPLYTPRQVTKYPFSPNTTSSSIQQPDLLSVPRRLMQSVSLVRESTTTVPKRISHFFHKSFGSGAGSSAPSSSDIIISDSGSTTPPSGGPTVPSGPAGTSIDTSYPFALPSLDFTTQNTTTTLLRPCIASRSVSDEVVLHPPAIYIPRPSRAPVFDRYSALYSDGERPQTAQMRSNDDENISESRPSQGPRLPGLPDHPHMGIAF